MTTKMTTISLLLGSLFLFPCLVQGQGARVVPDNLCPFTVEVYPPVLYVGDPLYVQMNFRNNTDEDAYAHARSFNRMYIERSLLEFHFKTGFRGEIIPWGLLKNNLFDVSFVDGIVPVSVPAMFFDANLF
jgi:hypothetical protein